MFFVTDTFNASVPAVPNGGNATPCPSAPTGRL
jgi:hypothetical protein